jgi:fused signal recognition particle receptor
MGDNAEKPGAWGGLVSRFKKGLRRTTEVLRRPVGGFFPQRKLLPEDADAIEEALYGADFGFETADEIVAEIREAVSKDKELRGEAAAVIGQTVLRRVLNGSEGRWSPEAGEPSVILLLGVNGAGKTTTAAKLVYHFEHMGHSCLLGACDTFRAAANEQLQLWAERLQVEMVRSQHGADPAAVAFDAYDAAIKRSKSVLILDTAGRLHTKGNLMEELKKIKRVVAKNNPRAPHHRWLVVDGSLGSNSLEQARKFNEAVGLTGLIVTKLDGTSRGGAVAAIYRELGIPVVFVGLGEKPEDLQPFSIDSYVDAIFGVGGEERED